MRVTRDSRGYETTFLMHTPRPGDRPRVLYWYRTAPGVRVGRRALDEDAIRTIEEQHPDIEFDWPTLLEEAESVPPDVEHRPERPRRKPRPQDSASPAAGGRSGPPPIDGRRAPEGPEVSAVPEDAPAPVAADQRAEPNLAGVRDSGGEATDPPRVARPPQSEKNPLLDQLVGREIASRLRTRYAEVSVRLAELPDGEDRTAWQQRADALDPDRWTTPDAILSGIQHADRLFDELKHELPPMHQA